MDFFALYPCFPARFEGPGFFKSSTLLCRSRGFSLNRVIFFLTKPTLVLPTGRPPQTWSLSPCPALLFCGTLDSNLQMGRFCLAAVFPEFLLSPLVFFELPLLGEIVFSPDWLIFIRRSEWRPGSGVP